MAGIAFWTIVLYCWCRYRNRNGRTLDLDRDRYIPSAPHTRPVLTTQVVAGTTNIIGNEEFSYPDDSIDASQPEPVSAMAAPSKEEIDTAMIPPSYGEVTAHSEAAVDM